MDINALAAIQTSDPSKQEELDKIIHSKPFDEWTSVRALKYLVENQIDFRCIFLKVKDANGKRN